MKRLLVINDPECEVGFSPLCDYCSIVQERLGDDVVVLPIWPHGSIELIDDENKIKLTIKHIQDLLNEFDELSEDDEDE